MPVGEEALGRCQEQTQYDVHTNVLPTEKDNLEWDDACLQGNGTDEEQIQFLTPTYHSYQR